MGLPYLEKVEHKKAIQCFEKAKETAYEVAPEILQEIEQYR